MWEYKCRQCGGTIDPKRGSRPWKRFYCSAACKQRAYRSRMAESEKNRLAAAAIRKRQAKRRRGKNKRT